MSETRLAEQAHLRAAQAGDRGAFDALAVCILPGLLGTATRLLGPGFAAEEAVAEALFRAFRHLGTFRAESGFSTWVHRILYRAVADRFRRLERERRQRRGLQARAAAAGESPQVAPLEHLADRELAERLRAALENLPPTQRLVLLLFAWEGLALREIAELLEVRYATVKSHLHHARSSFRRWLGREGQA